MKPGYQTSEYWLTVVVSVVALLVALGWVGPSEQGDVQALGSKIVTGVFALAATVKYIQSRFVLKINEQVSSPEPELPAPPLP